MKYISTFALLAGLLAGVSRAESTPAEPDGPLTLEQALALVAAHQPALALARLDVTAAEGRKKQAGLLPNPTLAAEAENFGGTGDRTGTAVTEYTVQIEQPLELGGKRGKRVRVAECERQLVAFDLAAAQLEAQAETQRRFTTLLAAQSRVQLEEEQLALTEDFCRTADLRVKAGRASPLETTRAQIELAKQRVARDQAAAARQTARIQLAALWNSATPRFTTASGEVDELPNLSPLDKLLQALPQNPDVARHTMAVEQRRAALEVARAARIPDLNASAGMRWFNDNNEYAFVAGVSLPLPVFDRQQGTLREANTLLLKAEQEQRAAQVRAQTALTTAHQNLAAARAKALALKNEVVTGAEQTLAATRAGYAQGKFAYLDVLEAQRTLGEARLARLDALAECQQAAIEIQRLTSPSTIQLERK